jgi:hypothetical protein
MGEGNNDGDLTQILFDRNGSLTGLLGSYVIRTDNSLLNRRERCQPLSSDGNVSVCNGSYGQVYVVALIKYSRN